MKLRASILFVIIMLVLTSIALPLLSANSQAADRVSESILMDVRLDGPAIIGSGIATDFTLRISYAYKERIINYSYTAEVIENYVEGGSITPDNGTAEKGIFTMSITGANEVGTMIIRVNATAQELGTKWYKVEEFEIEVVKPVTIIATLENRGNAPVTNVSVKLFVDDQLIETKNYSMNPVSNMQITFNWIFTEVDSGRHVISLVIDDTSETVEFSKGDNVITKEIYISDSGNPIRGILAIIIMFVAFILILTFLQKSTGKSKQK